MSDFIWDADYPPNQVLVYGNDEAIAIIERTQAQFEDANPIEDWSRGLAAQRQAVAIGHSALARTARLDVGLRSATRPKATSQ